MLEFLSNKLENIERVLCGALIVAFTLLLMVNVVSRYVFDAPIFFAEELALLILVWMGYLAIAYSVSQDKQIGMSVVVDRLPEKAREAVSIIVDVIMLFISCLLLWSTIGWLQSTSVAFEQVVSLDTPKWPFYLVLPVFWVALIIHILRQLAAKLLMPPENS